jgi:putative protease
MAAKKRAKTKTKAKTKKKSVKARAAPARARKKKPAAKAKPKARAAKPKAAVRAKPAAPLPRPTTPPAVSPAAIAGEERVGVVTHYYSHLSVAIIRMERGSLREGDTVHIKGHTSDFRQRVESMEIDHVHMMQVGAKQEFGMRVKEHAREHDVVYKVAL